MRYNLGVHAALSLGFVSLLGAALVGLSGCASEDTGSSTAPSVSPTPRTEPTADQTASPSTEPSTAPPADSTPTSTPITISIGGLSVQGSLDANAASASLIAQLPLDLSFKDFGGQEKIAGLPTALSLDGTPDGGSAHPGTIGYYAPDQGLVLYYDSVGYYPGIIPLGTFDDVAAIRDSGPFTATVSVTAR